MIQRSPAANLPDFSLERKAHGDGVHHVSGIDEAGRGPWAGPVVAAAVVLDRRRVPEGLNDSKKLKPARRDELFQMITNTACVGIAIAERERIDQDNILRATLWAMTAAVGNLSVEPGLALVDGNRAPVLACPVRTIVGGDRRSASVAAASIVAKVTRDQIMVDLDRQYPGYGFARHKGYGTRMHQDALERLGPCPAHRRSFAPVRRLMEERDS